MSALSTTTTNAAEALARIDSTLDQLYAAASTVIECVADYEALEAAPLHHRAAALTAIDRFIDRLEKRRAAEAPKLESKNEEHEKERWNNGHLIFTYGKYEMPLAPPNTDDEVYLNLLRRSEALREADEALMAAEAAAAQSPGNVSTAANTHPAPRVSPDHVRAQITPYADDQPAETYDPAPAAKSYSPLSSLGWSDDSYEHADDPLFAQ